MVWRVEISETAKRQLGKLCKRNPGVADRLLKKLDEASVIANPRSTGKAGQGPPFNLRGLLCPNCREARHGWQAPLAALLLPDGGSAGTSLFRGVTGKTFTYWSGETVPACRLGRWSGASLQAAFTLPSVQRPTASRWLQCGSRGAAAMGAGLQERTGAPSCTPSFLLLG